VRLSQLTGLDRKSLTGTRRGWRIPSQASSLSTRRRSAFPSRQREIGENYSAIGGFFRQYELIYIVAGERDVIRVRTNFRRGEDVYLYRTTASPEKARERFMDTSPR
jgi:Domain of unknown function (DUF4105)